MQGTVVSIDVARGRRGARRAAARRARVDEDGARRGRSRTPASCAAVAVAVGDTVDAGRPAARRSSRRDVRRGAADADAAPIDLDRDAARPRRGARASRRRARHRRPEAGRAAQRDAGSAPRARTSPTSSTTAASSSTAPLVVAAQRRRRTTARSSSSARRPTVSSAASAPSTGSPRDRGVVRLHGPRGHPGHVEPRARRTACSSSPSGAALPVVLFAEGGGGRPGRHRLASASPASTAWRSTLRAAQRAGAARRDRVRLLLRGQRRAARLLRRRHRHRGLEHRHGRPGDDRGRRARRVRARGDRPDRRAGRRTASSTCSCPTKPRRSASPSSTCRTSPARRRRVGVRRPAHAAAPDPREPRAGLRRARGHRRAVRHRLGARAAAAGSAPAWSPRWHASRAGPLGVVANNPTHLGGAIDTDAADKAARFLQLCDAFDLPVVFLCDTPGFMVGPDAGAHRRGPAHVSRMFVTGANLTVPFATVVLRKGYGLGAQAMAGGSVQGAAVLRRRGRRASSAGWASRARCGSASAASSTRSTIPTSVSARYEEMVERMYEAGKALNIARPLRDRRRHRPGRHPALGVAGPAGRRRPAATAHDQEASRRSLVGHPGEPG